MIYEIEKGIPIPVKNAGATYPFDEMNVGDSFAVENDGPLTYTRLGSAVAMQRKKHPETAFTVRSLRSVGLIRVWRTK